jgi:hypothetical protein
MIQEQTVRLEQTMHRGEIHRQILQTHMLEHSDAGDLVVDRLGREVAVIPQFDAHSVRETRLIDALLRHQQLLRTQGHAMRPHSVMLCGMNDQCPPAATDVEEILVGPQAQLAANMIQFGLLRGIQIDIRRFEIGAGIHHGAV